MSVTIDRVVSPSGHDDVIILLNETSKLGWKGLTEAELRVLQHYQKQMGPEKSLVPVFTAAHRFFLVWIPSGKKEKYPAEQSRRAGARVHAQLNAQGVDAVSIVSMCADTASLYAFAEGLVLAGYSFKKYRSTKQQRLKQVRIADKRFTAGMLNELKVITDAVGLTRDLVNEPQSYLNATRFSKIIAREAKDAGCEVNVLTRKKIEALKMGGLLAVNQGSLEPPTFSIIEYKHPSAGKKAPIVLVGKGVVFDTGGLSLKPTPEAMDRMKCDMAGGACVLSSILAASRLKLPLHIVGLIPATDNRPGQRAYVPGDVVRMFDGSTVEVLNTDAEGRMLLGDALAYAKQFKPALVIDLATLTGAAIRAIGHFGMVAMGKDYGVHMQKLKDAGESVHERLVEFPLWEEYEEELKSTIADVKNLGSPLAGATTAGKFLERFTAYPWIHVDISGMTFFDQPFEYLPAGGTGAGTRLIIEFLKNLS